MGKIHTYLADFLVIGLEGKAMTVLKMDKTS